MSPAEFGENLRRHRERRGVSLQAIADTSKINRRFLAALESGDCSCWPAGIYSRAYIRTYATAVGLDPEETVTEFADVFPRVAWPEGPPSHEPPPQHATEGRVASRLLASGTT